VAHVARTSGTVQKEKNKPRDPTAELTCVIRRAFETPLHVDATNMAVVPTAEVSCGELSCSHETKTNRPRHAEVGQRRALKAE
jgi:hypothetical protein